MDQNGLVQPSKSVAQTSHLVEIVKEAQQYQHKDDYIIKNTGVKHRIIRKVDQSSENLEEAVRLRTVHLSPVLSPPTNTSISNPTALTLHKPLAPKTDSKSRFPLIENPPSKYLTQQATIVDPPKCPLASPSSSNPPPSPLSLQPAPS